MSTENTAADAVEPVDPPHDVVQLVDRFKKHAESYRSAEYLETRVRREFLDPFFAALGWDVDNRSGYAEAYKEVIHEDSIKVPGRGGGTKAPDYCFRIGGARKFFVEAKKPSVNIRVDMDPAYQLRRYAWSAKLPLSLLTDFEELAVYDCRLKPAPTDATSTARTAYFTIDNYLDPRRWAEIAGIFSKDAILKGSFDRYVDTSKRKRGTAEVDDALLDEIENWRELLAKAIAKRNPQLSVYQLNHVVQATIDRIMFLRIAEDRGIEPYGALLALTNGEGTYKRLFERFRLADQRYNSGLFHFEEERGRTGAPDEIAPDLQIDDKPLKQILKGLYYPESPYEFSVFAPEILGQVYEQFLGKVIRLTPAGLAKIEEKPEVKKAGGVFYTPAYIVDYIVDQTIGEQLRGKTPSEIGLEGVSAKTRTPSNKAFTIVDPACGSGSFLLGAYQYLLDWYLDRYLADNPEQHATGKHPRLYQRARNDWRLTSLERKRILTTHIYGVDVDPQACEVTKLSLLLKVLEGESDETIGANLRLFHERALPDLSRNIKCGNSLVGPDFYQQQQISQLDDDARLRVNPFDWKAEFPAVMAHGGFDAVIGNPPYVRMEVFKEIKEYLRTHYASHEERADLYSYFIEKGTGLLSSSGTFGMIVSNKFAVAKYGEPLRRFLASSARIRAIADFAGQPVFRGATVRTLVLFTSPRADSRGDTALYVPVPAKEAFREMQAGVRPVIDYAKVAARQLNDSQISAAPWQLMDAANVGLVEKIEGSFPSLKAQKIKPLFGLKTGLNDAFIIDEKERDALVAEDASSAEVLKPILFGRDIKRYDIQHDGRYVVYLHPELKVADYPAVQARLRPFRDDLAARAGKQKWYELQQPAVALLPTLAGSKIVFPIIAPESRFALDDSGFLINDKAFVLPSDSRSLLACLNSRMGTFFFRSICAKLEGQGQCFYEFRAQFVERFPFPGPQPTLDALVEQMLAIRSSMTDARTDHERTALARQITALDTQIDQVVYALYGLSASEIQTIEQSGDDAADAP